MGFSYIDEKALELKTGEKAASEEDYLPEAKKNKELKQKENKQGCIRLHSLP